MRLSFHRGLIRLRTHESFVDRIWREGACAGVEAGGVAEGDGAVRCAGECGDSSSRGECSLDPLKFKDVEKFVRKAGIGFGGHVWLLAVSAAQFAKGMPGRVNREDAETRRRREEIVMFR
jgi:hypothetical protein